MSKSLGLCISEATKYIKKKEPDALLVLGDRFEILGVVQSAKILNIPIFHISGGDTSLGSLDNTFRDIITICSSFHFPKLPEHAKKIMRLGINKKNIFVTGSLSIENFYFYKKSKKKNIFSIVGQEINKPIAMVCFHPVTKIHNKFDNDIKELFSAIKAFRDIFFIFTASNQDPLGVSFNKKIKGFTSNNIQNTKYIPNLGVENYFNLLSKSIFMIGNSSSGVLESALFKIPSVNIRPRQDGRLKNSNVIDCFNFKSFFN